MMRKNVTVLITGANRGIGEATAYAFAKERAYVIITYKRGKKAADAVVQRCMTLGASDSFSIQLDVTEDASIKQAKTAITKKAKHIDILVNNAGIVIWKTFAKYTTKDIERELRTNLEGTLKVTHAFLPLVKQSIINIGSTAGIRAHRMLTGYSASKFGIRGFTQALADECPRLKIYCVHPDKTATQMNDFKGRPPEQVADVIVNAAKEKYAYPSGADILVPDIYKNRYYEEHAVPDHSQK